jgi:hypothetical protein
MAGTPISVPAGATPPAVPSGSLNGPFPSREAAQPPGAVPAPVPDSWYYCCRLPDGTVQIRQVSPADAAPCRGGVTVQGPFMSLAEAQLVCQGTPLPTPAAPAAPAPVFTPSGETWSCYEEPSGGKYIALTSAVPNVPGTVRSAGPFATYAEAYAVCGSPAVPAAPIPTFPLPAPVPASTPAPAPLPEAPVSPTPTPPAPATPQPLPEPVPSPDVPVWSCVPVALAGGIPPPGSQEWCDALDSIMEFFSAIGEAVWGFVDQALDPATYDQWLKNYASTGSVTNPAGYLIDAVVWLARQAVGLAGPVLLKLQAAIRCVREWVRTLFARCKIEVLLALWQVKIFLKSLEYQDAGTDLAAWAVMHLQFDSGPLMATVDALIHYVCPLEFPGVPEAIEAFLFGVISRERYECILRLNGVDPDSHEAFLYARSERLGPKETIQWVRRHGGSPEDEDDALRRTGFYDGVEAAKFRELYDELPTIGDHLEWLRKNVFQAKYVRDFHLLDGFGTVKDAEEVGYPGWQNHPDTPDDANFWQRFGHDLRALGMKKENAALHYAAHWLNPSLTQLFELSQRNRPGRVSPDLQFTKDDLLRVMQEQDIGVYFRRRLESISHPPPSLTQLMSAYGSRVIDGAEFVERLKDLGSSEVDAAMIVEARRLEVARQRANAGAGWGPQSLRLGWAARTVTAEFVFERMDRLGYSRDEAQDLMDRADSDNQARAVKYGQRRAVSESSKCALAAYTVGVAGREQIQDLLEKIGWEKTTASSTLQALDICAATTTAKAAVANIKKRYQKGGINEQQAREVLAAAGIVQGRIDSYLASWAAPVEPPAPQARAAQILKWVGQGLMTPQEAALRLERLGWKGDDRDLQLRAAVADLSRREAQAAAQAERTAAQRGRALARLAAEAESQARSLQASVRKATPPSTLQGWYARCVISEPWLRERLMAMGYSGEALEAEVRSAKEARAARAASAGRRGEEACADPGQPPAGP